jgi:hypothetical protein
MRRPAHHVCARWLAWLLALLSIVASPAAALAQAAPAQSSESGTYQYTRSAADGSLTLAPNAPAAPAIYGHFAHFGIALAPPQQFSTSFTQLRVDYAASLPAGTALRVDVRASADGRRWSAWEIDLASGASASFAQPARFAQYRATLLGNRQRPTLSGMRLTPARATALFATMSDDRPIAPTWKLRATRMGMVGGRTANGHRITKHDHFVSLPSWRSLAPNGTMDYTVRITYNGRSSVAPVYDVGPWNVHDNYWDEQRERFDDLPRGWPEDHAAYYDGYNGGRAEKGKVRFPTAVDVGDGVWWDDLGIKGDQATVEITFLWLGRDPLAAEPPPPPQATPEATPAPTEPPQATPEATPAPTEPPQATPEATPAPTEPPPQPSEVVADTQTPMFKGQAAVAWYDGPKSCGAGGHAYWTYTTTDPAESENSGEWRPALTAEAMYDVYVSIPACATKKPNTTSARYIVHHRDGTQAVVIDQAAGKGSWVLLGRFPFRAGSDGFVELRDVAGDRMRTIWFDALRWVPVQ